MKSLLMYLFLFSVFSYGQNAWINEFHYDNTGTPDVGEFVEVAVENSGSYDLSNFRISFYSSSSGTRYGVYHDLTTFDEGATDNNITLYSKMISGIQNGPNDGIALDYDGTVLHFISYEGLVTASEGVAKGETSVDVGVSESNSTPAGYSISLNGIGTEYSSFSWVVASDDTPGQVNVDQSLPVELTTFSASVTDNNVELRWQTETEINNYGFEIERSKKLITAGGSADDKGKKWERIGFVQGHGNSSSPKYYSFIDNLNNISGNVYYKLKQIDVDGAYKYSDIIEVVPGSPLQFNLFQNYPNPFNPSTNIQFELPADSHVRLSVFNILGERVAILLDGLRNAGFHNINFNGKKLNGGLYFYRLETNEYTNVRKMLLLK